MSSTSELSRRSFLILPVLGLAARAQDRKIRVIAFGAHPDDCDLGAGGTAIQWAAAGHAVKFVALTNGDAGHQTQGGGPLARRRRLEAQESGRRLGVEYEVLDNHDGELLPTLDVRHAIIRRIRQWKADLVIAPRSNDYHPDHRYAAIAVQDAAYMVLVPNVCPDTPPLRSNPVFAYFEDRFQKPAPFRPDVAIAIDAVLDKKIAALDAHVSQFYEWLPWVDGESQKVPEDPAARRQYLAERFRKRTITGDVRKALQQWYGPERAAGIRYAEAFEICEYGRQPNRDDLRRLFPMLP
jgi:LmbE family N-acetylglucosaminyl deacetylase